MSYVNYWNRPKDWVSKNGDVGINNYNVPLVNSVDFSDWLFLNENKDGLGEFAEQNNMLSDDLFHPSDEAHSLWADTIYNRMLKL